jgi:secreted Zn-dependent insulinase-like peptidase
MYAIISSKIFDGKTNNIEKWYKIKYNIYDNNNNNYFKINNHIIYNKIKKMINNPFNNIFIPHSFELKNKNINITYPILINTPNKMLLYYKQNIINIPKTNIVIKIYSEWLNTSPINKIILNFYIKLIKFNNYDFFNSIKIAGYTIVIKILDNKIFLIINGMNDKIYDVVENIINIFFKKNNINEYVFLFQKKIETNKLHNKIYESPHLYAYNLLKEYINPNFISYQKQIEIINNITFNDYNNILSQLLNNKINLSCFIIGDETNESLINISNIFTPFILKNNYIIDNNTLKIINNNNTVIEINEINKNINDANSAIIYSFHLDYIDFNNIDNAVTNLILMNLINSIISSKFFDTLRTKEQLGYIVQSKIKEIGYDEYPYYIHNLIIQSPHKCSEFIKNRINIFLSNFKQYLENISIDDINNYIHSQIEFHSKPFNNIKDDILYYTDIFLHNHTNFNLKNIILEKLKIINKNDIIIYFDKYYINGIKTIILLNSQNIHNNTI